MYVQVAVLDPSALMLWKTMSVQLILTLIYVGVHSVLASNCKVPISPHSNFSCGSMLLVRAVVNGVSKVIRKLLCF